MNSWSRRALRWGEDNNISRDGSFFFENVGYLHLLWFQTPYILVSVPLYNKLGSWNLNKSLTDIIDLDFINNADMRGSVVGQLEVVFKAESESSRRIGPSSQDFEIFGK